MMLSDQQTPAVLVLYHWKGFSLADSHVFNSLGCHIRDSHFHDPLSDHLVFLLVGERSQSIGLFPYVYLGHPEDRLLSGSFKLVLNLEGRGELEVTADIRQVDCFSFVFVFDIS
jgi:hypothetical protein